MQDGAGTLGVVNVDGIVTKRNGIVKWCKRYDLIGSQRMCALQLAALTDADAVRDGQDRCIGASRRILFKESKRFVYLPSGDDFGAADVYGIYRIELDSELTISAMSDKFGYSSEHFCRKFKEATGITPMTYLKIYRLEQALKKIKHSECSIGEIAAQCGFNDANYFTRCFKAHYGAPPRLYRAKEK